MAPKRKRHQEPQQIDAERLAERRANRAEKDTDALEKAPKTKPIFDDWAMI